jgi:hypothetical protein
MIDARISVGKTWNPSWASARSRPVTLMTIESRIITAKLVAIRSAILFMGLCPSGAV